MPTYPPERLLTLPNVLSLSRVPLGGVFWLTMRPSVEQPWWAFLVLAAAGVTDVLDGYFARRRSGGHASGMGSWLDPICDKLFVGLVLVALYVHRRPPVVVLALILTRELIQLPLTAVYTVVPTLRHWLRYDFRASVLGKAATVSQFAAVAALILNSSWAFTVAGVAFVLGVTAIADYVRRAIAIGKHRLKGERPA
jgi:cardiolipin synthase